MKKNQIEGLFFADRAAADGPAHRRVSVRSGRSGRLDSDQCHRV